LLKTVGFKTMEEQGRMPNGSEFQTEGAATLKWGEAKVVPDSGNGQQTGVGRALRMCRNVVTKIRVDVSRLRGAESVTVVVAVVLLIRCCHIPKVV